MQLKSENTVKAAAAILICALFFAVYLAEPEFFKKLWHIAASGNMQETIDYINSFGAWAMAVSFFLDVLINALGFLPSIFISAANGTIFGIIPGIIISWLAETVGVVISFFLMRSVLRSSAEKIIEKSAYLTKINDFSGENGFRLMLIARTLPYFPSGILTALGAISKISVRDYILANLIGKFPSTALEVIIGHDVISYQQNMDRLMAVVTSAVLVYGLLWYYRRKRKNNLESER